MLHVLREVQEPLTSANMARRVMERQGLDTSDAVALRRVTGIGGPALQRPEGKTVALVRNGSRVPAWRLAWDIAEGE